MFYALLKPDGTLDRYPYTLTDLIRAHPNTSWPTEVTEDLAMSYGLVSVIPVDPGPENPLSNRNRTAEKQEDGSWIEVWVDTPLSANEINDRTLIEAQTVRTERNNRLTACDWTQLTDVPGDKSEWVVYRQALRDLTNQDGFPWNVIWPVEP